MNLPPKTLKKQFTSIERPKPAVENTDEILNSQPAAAATPEETVPAVSHAGNQLTTAEDTTGSLPVLEAFHSFLENERRHARRQMITVTVFFFAILLFVVAGGAFVGVVFVRQTNEDLKAIQDEFAELKTEAKKQKESAQEALGKILFEAEKLRTDLSQSEQTVSSSRDEITRMLKGRESEMEKIQRLVAALENENKNLRADLTRLRSGLFDDVRNPPVTASETQNRTSTVSQVTLTTVSAPRPAGRVEFSILPEGQQDQAASWRMPILE